MESMLTALEADIGQTSLRDQRLLKKRLQGIVKIRDEKSRVAVLNAIKADVETAKQKISNKLLNPPKIVYPEKSSC
ncbi:ATP-dependent RNA helicase HrpA [Providencia stuartii]|nr:ATP-dependent RNA helicase HrpA [Providencia stuartii]